jgi:tryptophan 2,3-dioxygenase
LVRWNPFKRKSAPVASGCPFGFGSAAVTALAAPAVTPTPDSPGHSAAGMVPNTPRGNPQPLPGPANVSDYEKYMRVPELLTLQKPEAALVHHDELMFQVVHQSFELWCKLVLFELRTVGKLLDEDRVVEAYPLIERCTDVVKLQTDAIHVLERMHPMDFHVIRAALGQGSGAESPGFRDIQLHAPRLWPKVEALLKRRGASLLEIYAEPRSHPDLLRLLEHLTDLDMFFHIWRLNHLAMVKRVIGRDVKSLKGYAVHQLEVDVQMVLWPALWKVRNQITERAGTSPP